MFKQFADKVNANLKYLQEKCDILFVVNSDKETIWNTYLDSYPSGTNNQFRERTEHDCNSCRQFITRYGNIVGIIDGKMVSIWDNIKDVEKQYVTVAKALSKYVKARKIKDVFLTDVKKLGIQCNHENVDGKITTWNHFYGEWNKSITRSDEIPTKLNDYRTAKDTFERALKEFTISDSETILDLINSNSIYRGAEHKHIVSNFLKLQKEYSKLKGSSIEYFYWLESYKQPIISKIRTTSIGYLYQELATTGDIEKAVAKYEKIVAPENYKRPKAIFTKKMVEEAKSKIQELGFEASLGRKFALLDDLSINNVIYANRDVKAVIDKDVFDDMLSDVAVSPKKFNKVEEVSVQSFIKDILPTAKSVEVMFENKHENNLVSLIGPKDPLAPTMFKWGNNFSWTYNNNVTDSIKEAVKTRGGNVSGFMRFSIMWDEDGKDNSDLDAHCMEPRGGHISFSNKKSYTTGGELDIDIIRPAEYDHKNIVENIVYPTKTKLVDGDYLMFVHNYSDRGSKGFRAEVELNGTIYTYTYTKPLRNGEKVPVAVVTKKGEAFTIQHKLPSSASSKTMWNVKTQQFHKVPVILNSPNYWGDNKVGNEHLFFMMENCVNPDTPRGFFNEYLKDELVTHKRVFEALGSKMLVENSKDQLSGLGFSLTKKDEITVKVKSNFERVIKIKI